MFWVWIFSLSIRRVKMFVKYCSECGEGSFSSNEKMESCVNCGSDIKNNKPLIPDTPEAKKMKRRVENER